MNLPDDDNQWLKHSTVAIRSDAFGDNQWSKERLLCWACGVYSPNIQVIKWWMRWTGN